MGLFRIHSGCWQNLVLVGAGLRARSCSQLLKAVLMPCHMAIAHRSWLLQNQPENLSPVCYNYLAQYNLIVTGVTIPSFSQFRLHPQQERIFPGVYTRGQECLGIHQNSVCHGPKIYIFHKSPVLLFLMTHRPHFVKHCFIPFVKSIFIEEH